MPRILTGTPFAISELNAGSSRPPPRPSKIQDAAKPLNEPAAAKVRREKTRMTIPTTTPMRSLNLSTSHPPGKLAAASATPNMPSSRPMPSFEIPPISRR